MRFIYVKYDSAFGRSPEEIPTAPSLYNAKMDIEANDHFFKLVGYSDNEIGCTSNVLRFVRYMYEVDNDIFPVKL